MDKWMCLNEAISLAASAHAGQVRKGTDLPYIVHPLEVMAIVAGLTDDIEVLMGAVLHDTVEDTSVTLTDIREKFGERVAGLVAADSGDKREDRPASETWKIRKMETVEYVKNKATREEKMIVLGDKLSNLRAIYREYRAIGDRVWEKFVMKDKNEHRWYYEAFVELFADFAGTPEYEEYKNLVEKVWGM